VLPRLPGAKNDIKLVRQVLVSRYGFSDDNIDVVQDEAATRAGVLAALNKIVKEAGPNDVVYILDYVDIIVRKPIAGYQDLTNQLNIVLGSW